MILNEKKIFGSKGKNTIFNKFVTDTLTKIAKTILAYSFVLEHLGILYTYFEKNNYYIFFGRGGGGPLKFFFSCAPEAAKFGQLLHG